MSPELEAEADLLRCRARNVAHRPHIAVLRLKGAQAHLSMKILPLCLVTMRSHEYLDDFMHMSVVKMLSVANTLAWFSVAIFLQAWPRRWARITEHTGGRFPAALRLAHCCNFTSVAMPCKISWPPRLQVRTGKDPCMLQEARGRHDGRNAHRPQHPKGNKGV